MLVAEEQCVEAEPELARRPDILQTIGLRDERRRDLESDVQPLLDDGGIAAPARTTTLCATRQSAAFLETSAVGRR